MSRHVSILDIEASLGFNTTRGLSRCGDIKIGVLNELRNGFDDINTRYVSYGNGQVKRSQGIRRHAIKLFYELGAELWPNHCHPFWLFDPERDRDHPRKYLYPKNLYYGSERDRAM